jgi:hypothetical protein
MKYFASDLSNRQNSCVLMSWKPAFRRCHNPLATRHEPVIFHLYTVMEPTRVPVALK